MSWTISTILALLAVTLAAVTLLALAVDTLRFGISPTPTGAKARDVILDIVRRAPHAPNVVDLGSGAAGMVHALAKALPQSCITGIEASLQTHGLARLRAMLCGSSASLALVHGDFLTLSLNRYEGVYCYLYPGAMAKLANKLQVELPEGAWVVSYTFALPGWAPDRVVRVPGLSNRPIYVYTVPPRHKSGQLRN